MRGGVKRDDVGGRVGPVKSGRLGAKYGLARTRVFQATWVARQTFVPYDEESAKDSLLHD